MNIVSINDVVEINKSLHANDLLYKVHLRDACGKQSMWLERLKEEENKVEARVYEIIEDYFKNQHTTLEYSSDRMTFWVGK